MTLPNPTVLAAQAVLGFKQPAFDAGRDDRFAASAAASEFPHIVSRVAPTTAQLNTPSLVLASTSSQLAVSAAQADFQVHFYGDYLNDISGSVEYVRRKLYAALAACEAAGIEVSILGVVLTLRVKLVDAQGPSPLIKQVHLKTDLPDDAVTDVLVRVALKVRDIYFLNLTATTYEARSIQQTVFPGHGMIRLRPWEGLVSERGLELTLDMNNVLEAQIAAADPTVTYIAVDAIANTLKDFAIRHATEYLETGRFPVGDVIAASEVTVA